MINRMIRALVRRKKERKQAKLFSVFLEKAKELEGERLIIVDLGFNVGSIYSTIKEQIRFKTYYGFEMQRDLVEQSEYKDDKKLALIHAAVTNSDEPSVEYYEPKSWDKNFKGGATLNKDKLNTTAVPIRVDAIRLSKWICDTIADDDILVLKVDIEGAEYDVLDDLIASGAVEKINLIAIEWHCQKFGLENEAAFLVRKNSIKLNLWQREIQAIDWF